MRLHRPVVSPDGNFLATIVPHLEIHIISLAAVCTGSRVVKRITLPKSAQAFLAKLQFLKWSPEMMLPQDDHTNTTSDIMPVTTWLILSDGNRVIALSTELKHNQSVADSDESPLNILADFEVGDQFNKITLLDFVFSHRHALLLFESCSQASIISLTKFQRDDVLNPKFPNSRSFVQSHCGRYFSLLTRSNAQDYVSVFAPSDSTPNPAVTFSPGTLDAQGMQWSPGGQPLLVVWDSPTYGFKVSFFTALGHHLRQLDFGPPFNNLQILPSSDDYLGIGQLIWLRRQERTLLALACQETHVVIYKMQGQATAPTPIASHRHPEIIEPSVYPVWQESATQGRAFTQSSTAYEAVSNDKFIQVVPGVELIDVNADCSMIATKDATRPKTVWIWRDASPTPHTVLSFRENVTQILWHPSHANVLVVITRQRDPTVYVWHDSTQAPEIGSVPAVATAAYKLQSRFEGVWLPNEISGRYPFMMNSSEAFDVGFLDVKDDGVFFESVLRGDMPGNESSESISGKNLTPTPSERKVKIGGFGS